MPVSEAFLIVKEWCTRMESNSALGTKNIECISDSPLIPPSQGDLDWRLVALIGKWNTLPEAIKEAIRLIAGTAQEKEVQK